jgi:uncharacterized protein
MSGTRPKRGKKIDDPSFEKRLRKAESGDAAAQRNFAKYLFESGNGVDGDPLEEAATWYRRAAEQGDLDAQLCLAACLWDGRGVEKDPVEAVRWYRKVAELGNVEVQLKMADCFNAGTGVERDRAEAARWCRRAAEQGDAKAQNALGDHFSHGAGVELDFVEAVRWYRQAAEQGNADAQTSLGICLEEGYGVDRDAAAAAGWYRQAAEQGDALAQNNLGMMCCDRQYFAEAVKLFNKAVAGQYPYAFFNLAVMFVKGEGVDQDDVEAARLFRMAAEHEIDAACEPYGELLVNGWGVVRDCDEGLRWLRKCPDSNRARDIIDEVETEANSLALQTSPKDIVTGIRDGDSVLGTTPEGNTLLHFAAANLALEPVAVLLEHRLFDELVLRSNDAGLLARDVIGDLRPVSERDSTTARVIASTLSCRRSTRVACLLWCVEQALLSPSLEQHHVLLPREVGELIARSVLSPRPMTTVLAFCRAARVFASRSGLTQSSSIAQRTRAAKRGVGNIQADDCEKPKFKRSRGDP